MSYNNGSPNGELYIGNVKWSNDYQSTMLFDNTSARDSFMQSQLSKIKSNVIYYNKNGYIDVDSNIKGMSGYNYVYFKCDSDISNYWYCCFITDYDYIAPKTTRIYVEIDVIQTYLYATSIYKSMIDRAHILKSQDQINRWLAPEPVGAPPTSYRTIAQDDFNWTPAWIVHTTSKINNQNKYEYGGTSADGFRTGEYSTYVQNDTELKALIKGYAKDWYGLLEEQGTTLTDFFNEVDNFINNLEFDWNNIGGNASLSQIMDHTDEIIAMYCRPKWCLSNSTGLQSPSIQAPYCDMALNKTTLACSRGGQYYTPRNKKMLSSLCNCYQLHNQSGVNVNFAPEFCTNSDNTLRVQVQANPCDTDGYKLIIGGYSDLSRADFNMSYGTSSSLNYDANTGLNKAIYGLNAVISSAPQIIGGIAGISTGTAVGIASGVNAVVSGTNNIVQSLDNQNIARGSQGNLLSIRPSFQKLILRQVSPSYEECVAIDDFLDVYGYAIGEVDNVRSYMSTRSNWNYIKTSGINLSCPAPTNYINQLKSIFNNGITFWHNYETFGDYSQANN